MRTLTKTSEVMAELAAGGRIITGDRPGLLMLVDSGGSAVPAWQTALKSAGKQMTTATPPRTLPPVALAPARVGRTYIAGPMTGLPDFNHATFNAAAAALRAQGRTVINPADHGVVPGATWADYVRADLALLAGCETIYLLPGWSLSRGALLEHHVARTLGMAVEFAVGAEEEAGDQQPDLCDLCRTREEVRSDAEGIGFCQECWDGWQATEQRENAHCTCPSGDGSLRHPCPAHPAEVA